MLKPVELGHDERVASAQRRQGAVEPRPRPVCSGQTMIEVDPLLGDPETTEDLTLRAEVLLLSRATCVADQDSSRPPDACETTTSTPNSVASMVSDRAASVIALTATTSGGATLTDTARSWRLRLDDGCHLRPRVWSG
jgi:hypothetical protein